MSEPVKNAVKTMINEMLASLAHSAYHLGAIRQMLKVFGGKN